MIVFPAGSATAEAKADPKDRILFYFAERQTVIFCCGGLFRNGEWECNPENGGICSG
jgi:hypothetical protein